MFIVLAASCGRDNVVVSGEASLTVSEDMAYSLSFGDIRDIIFRDRLVTDNGDFGSFVPRRLSRESVSRGKIVRMEGVSSKKLTGGGTLLKIQEIECRDSLPELFIFRTSYVNNSSETIEILAWENASHGIESDELWSFQPSSTAERSDWCLPVPCGFYRRNYLGMNNTDYGGGIPMTYLWNRDFGVAAGLDENALRLVSMPVERPSGSDVTTSSVRFDFPERVAFAPGDTLRTYSTYVSVHRGDFFNALRRYSEMMVSEGFSFAPSEPEAYEPVWCAWGYERTFTPEQVIATLPKVKELGFKWVDVDDGYQIAEGDWNVRKGFSGGEGAMRRISDAVHSFGLKAKLWYAPLAADPGTEVLRSHPQTLLRTFEGAPEYITWWDSWYLSPVNPYTRSYTDGVVDMFIRDWNFDGLKLDGQHLNCCMPDYNPYSGLNEPEEAVERMPEFFGNIYERIRSMKPEAVIQLCPCGCAINFYHLRHFNQAVASDPTSSAQVRMKAKAYRALNNDLAYYADHVELTDGGLDFASQFGVGGVPGSKFTWPAANPDVAGDGYLLTPEKEALLKKWIGLYNSMMLSRGLYLNLYDMAFDKPEAHVIAKDGKLYYAFYADRWNGAPIELRGLEPGKKYKVREYASDAGDNSFIVDSSDPQVHPEFTGSWLIEAVPCDEP